MRKALGVVAGLLLLQGTAQAGRRPFLYAYDVPTVPEGDVEIESWLDFVRSRRNPMGLGDEWRWFIGPRWAPVDGFELSALTAFAQTVGQGSELWAELIEGRWRIWRSEGGSSLTLQLDLRIALAFDIPHQLQPQLNWIKRAGRIVGSVQAGYARGFAGNESVNNVSYDWVTWRAGIAVDAVRGDVSAPLQLGIESFGEIVVNGKGDQLMGGGSTVTIGPTLSIARGRLWLSAGVLFGLLDESPVAITRGIIGLAL